MKKIFLLLALLFVFNACAEDSKTPIPLPKTGSPIFTPTGSTAAKITLVITPTPTEPIATLIYGGSATIEATVLDANQAHVPDGTVVTFSVDIASLGTISPFATTSNGKATALFTARDNNPGTVTIVAKAGSGPVTSNSVKIKIDKPLTGSIEFFSATPRVIGIRGSGQSETATVTFTVRDIQGNPVEDGTSVDFKLTGPNGGEYIGTTTGSKLATAATSGGKATVILNSGSVAGPVTIVASVTEGSSFFQSSAPTISIGGGVVSAKHFVLAATRINLPGLGIANEESTITAFVADRFGNFNVLDGTSISFYTEAGAIDRSGTTNNKGVASVTFRTQEPGPVNFMSGDGNPRDGHVTILATVLGEEAFDDANGNGVYDAGELFDDLPEPFIDKDDDGERGQNPSVFEEFINSTIPDDGQYTGPNGVWDGPGCKQEGCQQSKMISTRHRLVFTGPVLQCKLEEASIPVPPGGSHTFTLKVGDINGNAPTPGTTITVKLTGSGKLSGEVSKTLTDPPIDEGGPAVIHFTVTDEEPSTSKATTIEVTVKPDPRFPVCTSVLAGMI